MNFHFIYCLFMFFIFSGLCTRVGTSYKQVVKFGDKIAEHVSMMLTLSQLSEHLMDGLRSRGVMYSYIYIYILVLKGY